MNAQDAYSIAIRIVGLAMVATSVALCLTPVMGILGFAVVGLGLFLTGGSIARRTYWRTHEAA
jgi:hypothetical protein